MTTPLQPRSAPLPYDVSNMSAMGGSLQKLHERHGYTGHIGIEPNGAIVMSVVDPNSATRPELGTVRPDQRLVVGATVFWLGSPEEYEAEWEPKDTPNG